VVDISDKAERKFIEIGDKIEKKIEDKGWKDKINYFFMDKMKIRKIQQRFNTNPTEQPIASEEAQNMEAIEAENQIENNGTPNGMPQDKSIV
jgi:hypothetical protein